MPNIRLVKTKLYEFNPNKKYLLIFDNRLISKEEAKRVSQSLGIKGVSIVVPANPSSVVKVMEGEDDGTK
jgi:hypothetical protein